MDIHNNLQSQTHKENSMDQKYNKVFVNPNFKRVNSAIPHNSSMYLNPNFARLPNTQSKTKIYVNPNFIRSNYLEHYQCDKSKQNNENSSAINYNLSNQTDSVATLPENKIINLPPLPMTKSRYSIVRHKNENKVTETVSIEKGSTTFKINKYKSVSINDIMKNLDTTKSLNNTICKSTSKSKCSQVLTQRCKRYISSSRPDLFKSRFKIVKRNSESKPYISEIKTSITRKLSVSQSKTALQSNHKTKINKKYYKKNNIPCPLFRKYGKCLRNDREKCEFLHDKKHVSICRRFLNGACFDKECLLSHDVTKKKMPTCSFYLKGMCTKDECPYLHVKLNEKTNICTDFLNGYCEKGDSCVNRHINICPNMATKGSCCKKRCPYPHKINKTIKSMKSIKMKTNETNSQKRSTNKLENKDKSDDNNVESRYYKEVSSDPTTGEKCELIQPIRCKLGTLPSFIQL